MMRRIQAKSSAGGLEDRLSRALEETVGDEDPRLVAALREYMSEVEAGRQPDRRQWLEQYRDIAPDLEACLDGLAFVQSGAAGLHEVGPAAPARDVLGLIAAGASAADDEAATDHSSAASAPDLVSQPLGDFRLIREIGRGGMGVVYEATQLSLGRRVAVKVLSMAAAFDSRHLQRFRNEAQAAAQLHHTNIVPVYAVGCERSVHFYAMQLIEGQSLADVVRMLRKSADSTAARPAAGAKSGSALTAGKSSGFSASPTARGEGTAVGLSSPGDELSSLRCTRRAEYHRSVARLGLQAAEALDHAHRQGIVHRDIKPANLLLDLRGNLWVTDFGLAQMYADDGLTRTGDLLGTLRYMSPEQASGRAVVLDQRTDVYSLGVTLYELLTLQFALPGATREQLLHQIGSVDPRSPRSIDRTIPLELETIIAKAAAKEPAERYPTARGLADDLQRFLLDEPIRARPPSVWDRAVKWTRRHRPLAVSALVMLLVASVGLLVSTVLIASAQRKTRAAYDRERQRAGEAQEQRIRAQKSFLQARQAVDFLARAASGMDDPRQFTQVRTQLLEGALAYYQGFLEDRGDDPSIAAELAAARARVTPILMELAAVDEYGRARFRARLLADESVRQALDLSSAQIDAPRPVFDGGYRPGPGGGDLKQMTPDQKREKFASMAEAVEDELDVVLTPDQSDRLRQISRQVRGPLAFSDPNVASALSLSREQKEKIRAIQSAFRDATQRRGPAFESPRAPGEADERRSSDGEPPRPADPADAAREKAMADLMALLTPAQTQTWTALSGPPFAGARLTFDRPYGPPSGRH